MSLKCGITLSDWKDMTFAGLSNVLWSMIPEDRTAEEESATQTDIDMFLA